MTLQYLAELYNNLVYSYDTHRYLIPDNLLRFNMRITIRDVRNMRIPDWTTSPTGSESNDNVSKFIYVLHDCQFDFMGTKNFGADMKRGGFSAAAPSFSAGGNITMNFKSYSKIMAPLLIDNSLVLDFKERESMNNDKTIYQNKGDYKTSEEVIAFEKNDEKIKSIPYRTPSDIITTSNQDKRPGAFQFPELNTTIRGFKNNIREEMTEVRDVVIKQIYEEVNQLATQGQRIIGNKLGFTIGKVNVYYDSLNQKVTRFAFMFEQFLESSIDTALDRGVQAIPSEANVYGENINSRRKTHYNQKFPEGDVNPPGTYNEKYPSGDVNPNGTYNEKYPEGDVNPKGIYNEKYPSGDVNPPGTYNEKYPEGDVNPNGTYNQKFPEGDVNPNGTYNEKYPSGDVNPSGTYNEKYPEGDVNPNGTYNEKYPKGDLMPKGTYNEKYPSGDLIPKGVYNEKYPKGDVNPKGVYNEKYPTGDLMSKGTYNEKYPEGDVNPNGTYNEKHPEGTVEPKGQYHDKSPEGRVEPDGKYHDKSPTGNLYDTKHKKLSPATKKMGNVNK